MCPGVPQVDYSAVGVFLNITFTGAAGGVPWWWTHPEVKAQEGLDPRAQARLSHHTRFTQALRAASHVCGRACRTSTASAQPGGSRTCQPPLLCRCPARC